jgi:hypothetical protein
MIIEPKHVGSLFHLPENRGIWDVIFEKDGTLFIERNRSLLLISSGDFYAPFSLCCSTSVIEKCNKVTIQKERIRFQESEIKIINKTMEGRINPKRITILPEREVKRLMSAVMLLYPAIEKDFSSYLAVKSILEKSNEQEIEQELKKLIGRGRGLTPSCDDMVSGFLAIYNLFCELKGLQKIRIDGEGLKRTNIISSSFIRYSQELMFDSQTVKFINSLIEGDRQLCFESVLELSRRGYSSGLDFCIGVFIGTLYLIRKELKYSQRTATKV